MPGFPSHLLHQQAPYDRAEAVIPSDTVDLSGGPANALWIGTAGTGTLRVTMAGNGAVVNFAAVPTGLFPFRVSRVHATGTGVSGIFAAY